MIDGHPWTTCPGALSQVPVVQQTTLLAYHCGGRLGPDTGRRNPALLEALAAFIMGQQAAQRQQHEAQMQKIKGAGSHG